MRKYINHNYLLLLLLMASSCSTLTKSQLNQVNTFGQLTKNFSAYPGKLVSSFNDIYLQNELIYANTKSDPGEHLQEIIRAHNFEMESDLITDQLDVTFRIIDAYGCGLVLLTSDSHTTKLDTAAAQAGTSIEGLVSKYNSYHPENTVPPGIAAAVSAVINLGGNAYIRRKEALEVKKIVPQADTLMGHMCEEILTFLQKPTVSKNYAGLTLDSIIRHERSELLANYRIYLRLNYSEYNRSDNGKDIYAGNLKSKKPASLSDDQQFLKLLQNLDLVENLRVQCIEAIVDLRKAHAQLLVNISEKKDIKETAAELAAYANDVKKMYSLIKAIKP
jgi:hypothetical protein